MLDQNCQGILAHYLEQKEGFHLDLHSGPETASYGLQCEHVSRQSNAIGYEFSTYLSCIGCVFGLEPEDQL